MNLRRAFVLLLGDGVVLLITACAVVAIVALDLWPRPLGLILALVAFAGICWRGASLVSGKSPRAGGSETLVVEPHLAAERRV